ncbi:MULTISPECIES: hypothetical protein [Chelativorans]|jgi:hypothetical protein|uniref:hypothetical protein n=1 Tax=Chelativorans TaxID=449972 RepID=UPI0002E16BF0|nr:MULTISPECIES: hypothetical protein [Chelativorans]
MGNRNEPRFDQEVGIGTLPPRQSIPKAYGLDFIDLGGQVRLPPAETASTSTEARI